jgi:hypothetical protein
MPASHLPAMKVCGDQQQRRQQQQQRRRRRQQQQAPPTVPPLPPSNNAEVGGVLPTDLGKADGGNHVTADADVDAGGGGSGGGGGGGDDIGGGDSGTEADEETLADAVTMETYAEDKFDAMMKRGDIAAQTAAQTRASSELLTMEAGDIRLNATLDRAGKVVHLINNDRLSRYETMLANTLTDDRPPHKKPSAGASNESFSKSNTLQRHPVYRTVNRVSGARGGPRRNMRRRNQNERQSPQRRQPQRHGQHRRDARLSRRRRPGGGGGVNVQGNRDGKPDVPIDVHVHVDTSNHELERKLVEGYGRMELLHKLEFDLMRQEFGTAIESLSDQVQRRIRNAEKQKQNAVVVNDIRRREEKLAKSHREKMHALKAAPPPKSTLTRARADLSLLKQGALVPTPEMLSRIMMEEELQEEERLAQRASTLRGANVMGREADAGGAKIGEKGKE